MRRSQLKSRHGCSRCKQMRRKCDEVKPVCGRCGRFNLTCLWLGSDQAQMNDPDRARSSIALPVRIHSPELRTEEIVRNVSHTELVLSSRPMTFSAFDRPSVLRTSACPDDGSVECKQVLQFLSDRGTDMLRVPTAAMTGKDVNVFRMGFLMASVSQVHLQAYLCLGAGSLARMIPSYGRVALKNYTMVMSSLRQALMSDPERPPAEWTCAVAAVLAFYEVVFPVYLAVMSVSSRVMHGTNMSLPNQLVVPQSPVNRLAHLVGFHRLVELRLHHQQTWSPLKILVEQYIHSLAIGALFHHQLLVGSKSISHIDDLLETFNSDTRPLGPEVIGVPEELTAVVYRLAVLNNCDVGRSPWDVELTATASKLVKWRQAPRIHRPASNGLFWIAELYYLACTCLLRVVVDRNTSAADEIVSQCLQCADAILEASPFALRPYNSVMWPLTILSVFALDVQQQSRLQQPIVDLVEGGNVLGYRSILDFVRSVNEAGIGPGVFRRADLLDMVHM